MGNGPQYAIMGRSVYFYCVLNAASEETLISLQETGETWSGFIGSVESDLGAVFMNLSSIKVCLQTHYMRHG